MRAGTKRVRVEANSLLEGPSEALARVRQQARDEAVCIAVGGAVVGGGPQLEDRIGVVPDTLAGLAERGARVAAAVALAEAGRVVGLTVDHHEAGRRADRSTPAVPALGRSIGGADVTEQRLLPAVDQGLGPVVPVTVGGGAIEAPAVRPIGPFGGPVRVREPVP